jgi:hypothetical protein
MLPLIIGIGVAALLIEGFSENKGTAPIKRNGSWFANTKKRLFISFAIEDSNYRDFLVAQAKNERSPFTFIDMSVRRQPWDEKEWKRKCRTKIKSCDGMIVLLSKNTWHSSGSRWEIKCAGEERIPVNAY